MRNTSHLMIGFGYRGLVSSDGSLSEVFVVKSARIVFTDESADASVLMTDSDVTGSPGGSSDQHSNQNRLAQPC